MTFPSAVSVLPPAEVLTLLREGAHDRLDTLLTEVQARYERGELSEGSLEFAFRAFGSECWTIGEKLRAWTQDHPESYVAHQAMALWLLGQAWRLRGGTTSDLVSDRGRRGMQHYLAQSEGATRFAMQFAERPLLSWLHLGNVACASGCDLALADVEAARWPEWFAGGLELEPHSLLLRRTMLRFLRTEWGGSDAHMLEFLRGQESALSSTDRQKLWAQLNSQLAHHALHFAGDAARAREYVESAVNLDLAYLYDEAYLAFVGNDLEGARTSFLRALRTFANDPRVRPGSKGLHVAPHLFTDSGPEAREVLAAVEREADAGELDAFRQAGVLLLLNPDLAEGAERGPRWWFERALDEGDASVGELYISVVRDTTHDATELMRAVLYAADEGSPEAASLVWRRWRAYRRRFQLDDRAKYRYLLQSADGGNNESRLTLARLLRRGHAELGDDGVLRPLRARPTKDSLDYATHLVTRVRHEGYSPWKVALRRRLGLEGRLDRPRSRLGLRWWVALLVVYVALQLVRLLSEVRGP